MSRWLVSAFPALVAVMAFLFSAAQGCGSRSGAPATGSAGTAVAVLVDYSKSFAPFTSADQWAIRAVVAAMTEHAARQWQPPTRLFWSKITAASAIDDRLCDPVEFSQRLVKATDTLDAEGLREKLRACVQQAIALSAHPDQQADFTDIAGAIAQARERTRSSGGHRAFVIFSDMQEDLPQGTTPVRLHLAGEHIVLLHRPGTDLHGQTAASYLARVKTWQTRLREAGAGIVLALPVGGTTERRASRVLNTTDEPGGTSVSVIVSLPSADFHLEAIALGLASLANRWPPPVTFTWSAVRDSALTSRQMPACDYAPRLIKRDGSISTQEDLRPIMEECGRGIVRVQPQGATADLTGAIMIDSEAAQPDDARVLILVSDFADSQVLMPLPRFTSRETHAVMVSVPRADDAPRQQAYFDRLESWDSRLRAAGAKSVCRLQLNDLTPSTFLNCFRQE